MERLPVASHPWGDHAGDTESFAQVNPSVNDSRICQLSARSVRQCDSPATGGLRLCQEKYHHCLCKHSLFASPIAKAEVRHREAIHGVSKKTMVKGSKINRCAFVSLSLEEKGF
jgi:hypothetical protein